MAKEVKDSLKIRKLKHQARRQSIKEGIFSSAKSSFGDRFISPFAVAINSSNSLVALLSSVSGLLGPISQIVSAKVFKNQSRKKAVMKLVFTEALIWLPFVVLAILFYSGTAVGMLPLFLLLVFSIYVLVANAPHPLWFSWMGDLVDDEYRGRWFSKRKLIMGFTSGIIAVIASLFLDYFVKKDLTMIGFAILFFLAFLFRIFSWTAFKKQYEPKFKFKKRYYFSFFAFIKKAPKTNFGKFSIFGGLLAFTAAIFSSLLTVYLLRTLNLSYLLYMAVLVAEAIFAHAFLRIWGNFADRYGNYRVLAITTIMIPLIPILWFLSPSPIYLLLVPTILGGTAWAGFDLATGNFIYDNVRKEKRELAVSYYNMFWGFGIFLGSLVAAVLIKVLTISFMAPIIFIFLLSAIGRMIVVFWWIPKIKEVKNTKKFSLKRFEKGITPALREEIHEIVSIRKYLRN